MADRPEKMPDNDIRKCGEEIKQLRNQQFILGTVALTLFGAYASLLMPRSQQSSSSPILDVYVWSSITLLGVLVSLFWWSRQLRVLIGVISTWLEVTGSSPWESDFRQYFKKYRLGSQTRMVSLVFLALGVAVPLYLLGLCALLSLSLSKRHLVYLGSAELAYLAIVILFGFVKWGINDKILKENWRTVLSPPPVMGDTGKRGEMK